MVLPKGAPVTPLALCDAAVGAMGTSSSKHGGSTFQPGAAIPLLSPVDPDGHHHSAETEPRRTHGRPCGVFMSVSDCASAQLPHLPQCAANARTVRDALARHSGFDIRDDDAATGLWPAVHNETGEAMRQLVAHRVGRLQDGDTLFLLFTGHGCVEDGRLWLRGRGDQLTGNVTTNDNLAWSDVTRAVDDVVAARRLRGVTVSAFVDVRMPRAAGALALPAAAHSP